MIYRKMNVEENDTMDQKEVFYNLNSKISTNVFEEAGITPETLIKLGLPEDSRSLSPIIIDYATTISTIFE